jgi:hypothetical protein
VAPPVAVAVGRAVVEEAVAAVERLPEDLM